MLVYADRVKETTSTSGTGAYTLEGAVVGNQSFAVVGDGNVCEYACTDGTNWEVGLGTYVAAGTILQRTAIYDSSNAGAAISWGTGAKTIFVTQAANNYSALTNEDDTLLHFHVSDRFVKLILEAGDTWVIPDGHQYLLFGDYEVNGVLDCAGEMVIL